MRRAPIVLTSTVVGVVAVLTFHAREPTVSTAAALPATGSSAGGASTGGSGSVGSTPAPGSGTAGAAGTTGSGTAGATGTGASGAGDGSSSASATGTRTATGKAIDTQYGAAQVKVTVTDGKITDVQAVQLQGNEPKSVQISGSAAPQLRASALQKQSAAIDAVSGATITSASYEASLQSALDELGFKASDGSRGTSTVPQVEEHHDGGPGGGAPSDQLFVDPGGAG